MERGHVFTDRLLHARGREETMILGSAALKPVVRSLVPGVEIVERPRFSDLSYAGAKKISRLPRRSATVPSYECCATWGERKKTPASTWATSM